MKNERYDMVVIGGGSAGLVAAGGAGLIGAKTLLVEKSRLGGECLHTGCVPSKALIKSSRIAHLMRNADKFGFAPISPAFSDDSFGSIRKRVREVVEAIAEHDRPEVFEELGAEVVFGEPAFVGPQELSIALHDGSTRQIRSKRFCIATGSSPFIPQIPGIDEIEILTNENVFELETLPSSLVVVGGGAIGCELAQAFARLGSKVTIVEMTDRILGTEDPEASKALEEAFELEGIEILTSSRVVGFRKLREAGAMVRVESECGDNELDAEHVLVAVGRAPNVENLSLELAGVEYTSKGVGVDPYLRTSNKNIYACGDVIGEFQFTHMADHEAQTVLNNAFSFWPLRKRVDHGIVPRAIFTDPEIAATGLSEHSARLSFADGIEILRTEFSENDRAVADGAANGFAKIIVRKGKVIGATIVGSGAGELIQEFTIAVKHKMTLSQLNEAIHVYPTISKIAQALSIEETMHFYRKPLIQRVLRMYLRFLR
ncbi:MAG: FAD-dependent oxidoreductase [Pyrinomonadaceae bacterium]